MQTVAPTFPAMACSVQPPRAGPGQCLNRQINADAQQLRCQAQEQAAAPQCKAPAARGLSHFGFVGNLLGSGSCTRMPQNAWAGPAARLPCFHPAHQHPRRRAPDRPRPSQQSGKAGATHSAAASATCAVNGSGDGCCHGWSGSVRAHDPVKSGPERALQYTRGFTIRHWARHSASIGIQHSCKGPCTI